MGMRVPSSFPEHGASLPAPRSFPAPQQRHALLAMLVMAVCAVLGGADGWEESEEYGTAPASWCSAVLDLPPGRPGHATFQRVWSRLAPDALTPGLRSWPAALRDLSGGASGAIAGKTRRQALDRAAAKAAIHLVRAGANRNRLGLGHVTVEDQSTDMTALPQLLKLVDCTGAPVTSEAMGGQQASATGRTEHGADDVLARKKKHSPLSDAVPRCRDPARAKECAGTDHAYDATGDGAPGRIAIGKSWLPSDLDG
jgi:hypothetical protein